MLRLKYFRELRMLTQEELGDMCGLSQEYISYLEQGERIMNPPFNVLNDLAIALDICFYDLIDKCTNCKYDTCKREFFIHNK